MSHLSLIFLTKMSVTTVLVALPFLLAPPAWLEPVVGEGAKSPLLLRLYGAAVTALLVGYGFGIFDAEGGRFPTGVVCMAPVSNAGAAGLLLPASKRNSISLGLGLFFASVAIGLMVALWKPQWAISKAW